MKVRHAVVAACTVLLAMVLLSACCGEKVPAKAAGGDNFWQPAGEGDVLAKVGDIDIYMSMFTEQIGQKPKYVRSRYNTMEKKKEFLDNLVTFEALSQEAVARGLAKDPSVVRAAKQAMLRLLMEKEIEQRIKADDITDAEMQAYYDEHKADYNNPERRRAAHILIKVANDAPQSAWDEAKKKAQKIYKDAVARQKEPNSFRKLAKEFSDDTATKNRGGDLSYFARTEDGGPMVKAFSDAVFEIDEPNTIIAPVKTKFGWHIIKLTGKLAARERTFEQVKPRIKRKLFKQKQQDSYEKFVASVKDKMKITIDEKLLEAYVVPGAGEADGNEDEPAKIEEEDAEEAAEE